MRLVPLALFALGALACTASRIGDGASPGPAAALTVPPPATAFTSHAAPAATLPTAAAAPAASSPATDAPSAPPAALDGAPCGPLDCRLFDSPEAAFAVVLRETDPLVLAVGEAHAQQGTEGIASATQRFTESLLPLLRDRASDLVVELLVATGQCADEKRVATAVKPVVEPQAKSNQDEFLTLATVAKQLGMTPWRLRPSCVEYRIAAGEGLDTISRLMALVAKLTIEEVERAHGRNEAQARTAMVVTYGGALHNDRIAREGRETWTFGPALAARFGRYAELDLIVPEYIEPSPSWQALAWYPHFDPSAHPRATTLFQPTPGSYVLVFPRSAGASREPPREP